MTTTNMRVLRPSRKKPKAGDLFVLQLPDDLYRFGRVVSIDATIGPMTEVILIYIYNLQSSDKAPPKTGELRSDQLLISPILTNRLPWSRGYFETVSHVPLAEGDVLAQHCFRRWDGRYFDEFSNELPGPVEPVGEHGLGSYRTIDDELSEVLGFDAAPD